jgi:hypothetical protein
MSNNQQKGKYHTTTKHVPNPPNIPLKIHLSSIQIGPTPPKWINGDFSGNVNELEDLGKTPLRFHHAQTRSIELHSCPLRTPNIH